MEASASDYFWIAELCSALCIVWPDLVRFLVELKKENLQASPHWFSLSREERQQEPAGHLAGAPARPGQDKKPVPAAPTLTSPTAWTGPLAPKAPPHTRPPPTFHTATTDSPIHLSQSL